MKKLAIIAMALTMALVVTACSNNDREDSSSAANNSSSQVQDESSSSKPEEDEESSSPEESQPGDLDENISQPPTGAEDEPDLSVDPDKVVPEE